MRENRVRLLKRFIIIVLIVLIVLPMILCIYLSCRVHKLEEQVQDLYETRVVETRASVDLSERTSIHSVAVENQADSVTTSADSAATVSGNQVPQEALQINEIKQEQWPRRVYLTFDDGPSCHTDDILDILNQYGVKASFFVVGTKDPELQEMYSRIVDEGHVLGMHSYSHEYQKIYASLDAFADDLNKLRTLLYEQTGEIPVLYRFPGGSSNTVSPVSMGYFIDYLTACNITYYDWNISSGDASTHLLPAEDIVRNSLYRIDENEETMILLHDLGDKTTTVEALPEIIEALQARNIPISAIDENTIPIQHILE